MDVKLGTAFALGMLAMFGLAILVDWLLNLHRKKHNRCRNLQCPYCGTPLTHNNLKLFQGRKKKAEL